MGSFGMGRGSKVEMSMCLIWVSCVSCKWARASKFRNNIWMAEKVKPYCIFELPSVPHYRMIPRSYYDKIIIENEFSDLSIYWHDTRIIHIGISTSEPSPQTMVKSLSKINPATFQTTTMVPIYIVLKDFLTSYYPPLLHWDALIFMWMWNHYWKLVQWPFKQLKW